MDPSLMPNTSGVPTIPDDALQNSPGSLTMSNDALQNASVASAMPDDALQNSSGASTMSNDALSNSSGSPTMSNDALSNSSGSLTMPNDVIHNCLGASTMLDDAPQNSSGAPTMSNDALPNSSGAPTMSDNALQNSLSALTLNDALRNSSLGALTMPEDALQNSSGAPKIPDDIVAMIIQFLPLPDMVHAKLLCKQSNVKISTEIIPRAMVSTHLSSHPWLFYFGFPTPTPDDTHCHGYDPLSNNWYLFRIPRMLRSHNNINLIKDLKTQMIYVNSIPRACLTMCNPFSKLPWTEIPLPSHFAYPNGCKYWLLSYIFSVSATKLVFAWYYPCFPGGPMVGINIYVGNPTNAWRVEQTFMLLEVPTLYAWMSSSAICNNIFYTTITTHIAKHYVMAYNLSDNFDTSPVVSTIPCSFRQIMLINCKERLMMVGSIISAHCCLMEGIGIWKWQEETLSWEEIDRMPAFKFHCFHVSESFYASGSGDLIYIFCRSQLHVKIIIFNVVQKSWDWVFNHTRFNINFTKCPFTIQPGL